MKNYIPQLSVFNNAASKDVSVFVFFTTVKDRKKKKKLDLVIFRNYYTYDFPFVS